LRPTRIGAILDAAATSVPSATEDEIQILSIPARLRRSGREITMVIDGTDPFATTKPDARLVKLMIKARRFNAALLNSDGVPFAALAKREGVSPSYFTRLVRLSYLAPDIIQAILDGRQSRDLTADKLLAHSRLPLGTISEPHSASPEPHQHSLNHRLIGTAVSCWCVVAFALVMVTVASAGAVNAVHHWFIS
jgi:hypothetical protein